MTSRIRAVLTATATAVLLAACATTPTSGEGGALFREAIEAAMRTPAGVENWYLKVIDQLAPTGKVGTLSIEGMEWGEVDFLNDVDVAEKLTAGWL